MGLRMFIFLLAYVDISSSIDVDRRTAKVPQPPRRTIGSDIKTLIGVLRQDNVTSPIEQIHNFTELVMNFVNTSYKCGSEEAQKIVPQIIRMLNGIFGLPFINYFVNTEAQKDVIKALEVCGSKKVQRERKRRHPKKRHRNKVEDTEWRAFFTGAIENAEPKESKHRSMHAGKSNKTMKLNFKSLLDDILKSDSTKSQEKSKDALLRIILEIDDYLQKEKNRHKQDSRFKRIGNGKKKSKKNIEEAKGNMSNGDSKIDFKESILSKPNRDSMKDDDDADISKSNRAYKKYLEEASGSSSMNTEFRADSGTIELKTSDEVVLDQNMEISVRMDGSNVN